MDFTIDPGIEAVAAEAAELARSWRDDRVPEDSWVVGHSPTFAKELAARGWIGMTWPVADGGAGRTALERFMVFEQLIAGGAPLGSMWFADRQMGPTLLQFGTDEQRRRWLPGIVAGESVWCIGMSEPDHGSDLAGLRTRAVRDGDGWVLDGQKVWTSGAARADWIYVVARTDPDAARPHEGLSELVVDMHAPGVEVRPITDMTGDTHFCEVRFDRVRVPGGHLVGAENGSFRQLMRQLEHERGGVDRLLPNRLLYEDVRRLADTADPVLRPRLADVEARYRQGRLLVLREVLGQAPRHFSAATKLFCTRLEQDVSHLAATVAGVRATAVAPGDALAARIARSVAYAPSYTIAGGTSEILRTILAERALGLPRAPGGSA